MTQPLIPCPICREPYTPADCYATVPTAALQYHYFEDHSRADIAAELARRTSPAVNPNMPPSWRVDQHARDWEWQCTTRLSTGDAAVCDEHGYSPSAQGAERAAIEHSLGHCSDADGHDMRAEQQHAGCDLPDHPDC
jgi:hypothetical protein